MPLLLLLVLLLTLPCRAQPSWVVVHDGNGVRAHNIPQNLSSELTRLVNEKQPIRSVFLTHNSGWGVIYGRNGYLTSLPSDMADLNQALQIANQQNQEIRVVTVTPDSNGWAILLDYRQIVAQRCPSRFVEFYTGSNLYHRVECLALGAGGFYLMTFDQNGYDTWVSPSFLPELETLNKKREHLRFVWMAPGQEGVVYGANGLRISSLAEDLKQVLLDLNARNKRIELVAVRMDGSGDSELALSPSSQPNSPPPPQQSARTLAEGGATVELPAGVEATARLQKVLPPAPANTNTRIVSESYYLNTQKLRFNPAMQLKLRFDPSKVMTGRKVYPVLGAGPMLERLTPDRIDMQQGVVEFHLDHILPRVHAEGETPNKYFFAVASDLENLTQVFDNSDCTILGAGESLEKARKVAPQVGEAYSKICQSYRALGFALPPKIDIYLVPLKGARGEADGSHISLDLNLWDNGEGIKGTLAHESFHVCQANSSPGFETDNRTVSESNWAAEATAHYMGFRQFPRSPNMLVWTQGLRPGYARNDLFTFVPNSEGENPNVPAHQYQSFIFFAYLETLYPVNDILKAMYRNPNSQPAPPAASLPQLLNNLFQSTADRSGRKRGLADVYVDFLVHYLYRKDFQPLAGAMNEKEMGGPNALNKLKPQLAQLPYENPQRRYTKVFRGATPGYGLVGCYDLSSMTRTRPENEQGDLTVRAVGPGELRLVVFPYTDSVQAPLFGSSARPVVVPRWEKLTGALVWLIHAGEDRGIPVAMEASMPGGPGRLALVRDPAKPGTNLEGLREKGRTFQLNGNSAIMREPDGRTFEYTWTNPPAVAEEGGQVSMEMLVRRTQGDDNFRMTGMWLTTSGNLGDLVYQGKESYPRAWVQGNLPGQNSEHRQVARYLCRLAISKVGETVSLELVIDNCTVSTWTYRFRKLSPQEFERLKGQK